MSAGSLYNEVCHVCRITLQRGVPCLQNHFAKRCDIFADSLYKRCDLQKGVTFLQTHFTKRCDMFAEPLYKEV